MKKTTFALLGLFLAGCASSGTNVDPKVMASFQAGKTTKTEIITALGAPNGQATLGDGTSMITYAYVHAQANAASFIPVVGLVAGGASATTQQEAFFFDKNDVLARISTNNGQSESHLY